MDGWGEKLNSWMKSGWASIRQVLLRYLGVSPPTTYRALPHFEPIPNPFMGGMVFARESNDRKDDILYADFAYFDGLHWVILGRDYGVPHDASERTGFWGVWWDIKNLQPRSYPLRVEMYDMSGLGYGSETIEVTIARAPKGAMKIASLGPDSVTFSAGGIVDPDGGEVTYNWKFDDGREATEPDVTLPEFAERLPIVFSVAAVTSRRARLQNVYLFLDGILLSLIDNQVAITLGNWSAVLREVAAEKEKLKSSVTPANQAAIDRAAAKLREAADKVNEAKKKLAVHPPDEAGAKALIREAQQLAREAIDELNAITQQRSVIDANIAKLREVMVAIPVGLLEADYLIDHIDTLTDIIAEKGKLTGLPAAAQDALKNVLRLLADAKALLDAAKAALLLTPPDIATAMTKTDAARKEIRKAGKELERVKPPPSGFTNNIEKLKILYLELCFLDGKLWLLEQIGLDNPHADIPFPKLTRDHDTATVTTAGEIEMGPKNDPVNDDGWELDVTYHELDHWFLFKKNGRNLPGGHHWYDEDLAKSIPEGEARPRGDKRGRELAWSEGWANFSSCAKRKDYHYFDEGEEGRGKDTHFTPEKDLEHDQCKNPGDKAMHPNANKGPAVEGSISGILWDLFDGDCNGVPDLDGDGVCVPFKWLWQAINEMTDDDILGFYKSLRKAPRPRTRTV